MEGEESKQTSDASESSPLLAGQDQIKPLTTCYKVLRIVTLFWLWFTFGAFSEITGPVVPELIAQTHSQYETIAQALSMRGAGHALGGMIGGLTVDRWFRHIDLLMSVIVVFYTGVSVLAAYIESTGALFAVFFIQGSIETWLQTAGYRIALKTWMEKSAGPLHALHMGYGLGSIVSPQIVTPFLDSRFSGGVIQTGYNSSCRFDNKELTTASHLTVPASNITTVTQTATPKYPADFVTSYWIISGLSLAIAILFLTYFIHSRVTGIHIITTTSASSATERLTFRQSVSPKTCSPTRPTLAALIIVSLFFYYIISVPLIRAFSKFIFSYARDGPCLSVEESTILESVYFAALTVGRLCAFLVSSGLHMKFVLQVEVIGVLICALILFFLHNNISILWIACTALGFFTGPIIPSAFAWANRYIEVTSTAQIVPQIGAAIGDVAFLMGVGFSYQHYGPYVLWSYQLILAIGICVTAWIMQILGSSHGDRYQSSIN